MTNSDSRQLERLLGAARKACGDPYMEREISLLVRHYELVLKWNQRLNLTTITSPADFLSRNIFESSLIDRLIPAGADSIWDIGSGAGVPAIPLAIFRPGLEVHMVEASRTKSIFLDEAVFALGLENATVHPVRFEDLGPLPARSVVTARAVERMERLAPGMADAAGLSALFLGAGSLARSLESSLPPGRSIRLHPVPGSAGGLLIEIRRST